MQFELNDLEQTLRTAAAKIVDHKQAGTFARLMAREHLQKAPRINPLREAADDLKSRLEAGPGEPKIAAERPGFAVMDFQGLVPSLNIGLVHDELETRARQNGLAALGLRNSGGIIVLSMWVTGLADRGLAALAMFNGGVDSAVPHGGVRGYMGTNPLAYALPGMDEPLVLDMATTEIPYFQIKESAADGTPLPSGAAVDNQGRRTTDPNQAFDDKGVANLLPMGGGYKGYGLMLLVEVLTGALVGTRMSDTQSPGWNPTELGGLIIAFDPGVARGPDAFSSAVSALTEDIRSQPAAPGGSPISVPGDRGRAAENKCREQGWVEVDDKLADELKALAG